jgi:DNA-binding transcriptional LysR family regulator
MIAEDLAQGRLIKILEHEVVSPNRREPVQAVYYKNTALSSRISAYLDYIEPRLQL